MDAKNPFESLISALKKAEDDLEALEKAKVKPAPTPLETALKKMEAGLKEKPVKPVPLAKAELKKCGYCGEEMAKCGCDRAEKYAKGEMGPMGSPGTLAMSKNALNPAAKPPAAPAAPKMPSSLPASPLGHISGPTLGGGGAKPAQGVQTMVERVASKMKPKLPGVK